jgi:Protein kinase domain
MSPELILLGVQSKATDIWAAGVVLYILLCGFPPFYSKSNRETLELSAKGQFRMDSADWASISEDAKDLVRRMLTVDLAKRITTSEILSHPFLVSCIRPVDSGAGIESSASGDSKTAGDPSLPLASKRSQEVNLDGALRRLSDMVGQRRTEKMVTTLTKMMSSLRTGRVEKVTSLTLPCPLSVFCVVCVLKLPSPRLLPQSQLLTQLLGPMLCTNSPAQIEDDMFQLMTSSDARKAISATFAKLGTEGGKLTFDQFSAVLRHFGFGNTHSKKIRSSCHLSPAFLLRRRTHRGRCGVVWVEYQRQLAQPDRLANVQVHRQRC